MTVRQMTLFGDKKYVQYKKCYKCYKRKPLIEFPKSNSTRDGYGYYCKTCESVRKKQYFYNITTKEYELLLKKQDYKCAICHSSFKKLYGHLIQTDHDHETGKVRGILCSKCNRGIRFFEDNIILLENAIKYLLLPPFEK